MRKARRLTISMRRYTEWTRLPHVLYTLPLLNIKLIFIVVFNSINDANCGCVRACIIYSSRPCAAFWYGPSLPATKGEVLQGKSCMPNMRRFPCIPAIPHVLRNIFAHVDPVINPPSISYVYILLKTNGTVGHVPSRAAVKGNTQIALFFFFF